LTIQGIKVAIAEANQTKGLRDQIFFSQIPTLVSRLALNDAICEDAAEMPKDLAPVIEQLKQWRAKNKLSQAQATKVFNLAGLPITLDALQSWEIGRRSPNPLAAVTLEEFLNRNPKIKAPVIRRKKTK
jgi:DNA-binding transcriptional regulator YiaG